MLYELTSKFNLTIFCIILVIITLGIYAYLFKFNENIFCLMTGILIFFPVCFLENPVHLILLGVTMHYSQYITMTYKVTVARKIKNKLKKIFKETFLIILIFIFLVL
jgi:hypothetical protein